MASTDKLSRREREIMDALYALGDSADGRRHPRAPDRSAQLFRGARDAGEARSQGRHPHRAEGLRYVYSPVTSRTTAQKKAVSQLMRVFFGGSASQAATALLKQESWSDDELERVAARDRSGPQEPEEVMIRSLSSAVAAVVRLGRAVAAGEGDADSRRRR